MNKENKTFNFGYLTDLPCEICNNTPAEIEPRFNYVVCELHSKLSPVEISRLIKISLHDNLTEHK